MLPSAGRLPLAILHKERRRKGREKKLVSHHPRFKGKKGRIVGKLSGCQQTGKQELVFLKGE